MTINHFAISQVKSEPLGRFLHRLADEVERLEKTSSAVQEIIISVANQIDSNEPDTAVVFFRPQHPRSGNEMSCLKLMSAPSESSADALADNMQQLTTWLMQNPSVEIYDVGVWLDTNPRGEDVSRMNVYYERK